MAESPTGAEPRPIRRSQSALDASARAFLDLRLIGTLGTLNADGSILLTPVWYIFDEGRLCVGTSAASRKVRNVEARPRATLLVDQRAHGGNRWLSAVGTAAVVHGDPARAINARIRARYLTRAGEAAYGQVLAAADDVAILLTPESWTSWQPALLARTASERGVSGTGLQDWFLRND